MYQGLLRYIIALKMNSRYQIGYFMSWQFLTLWVTHLATHLKRSNAALLFFINIVWVEPIAAFNRLRIQICVEETVISHSKMDYALKLTISMLELKDSCIILSERFWKLFCTAATKDSSCESRNKALAWGKIKL